MARKALLSIDGFTKQMDAEYVSHLCGGRSDFKYPLRMVFKMTPMDRYSEEPCPSTKPIVRFRLVGRSLNWDYFEGEVEEGCF